MCGHVRAWVHACYNWCISGLLLTHYVVEDSLELLIPCFCFLSAGNIGKHYCASFIQVLECKLRASRANQALNQLNPIFRPVLWFYYFVLFETESHSAAQAVFELPREPLICPVIPGAPSPHHGDRFPHKELLLPSKVAQGAMPGAGDGRSGSLDFQVPGCLPLHKH